MSEILTYEKPQDFFEYNHDYIYNDYFSHYHLIRKIEDLLNQKSHLYDCFNIVDDKSSFILCIRTTEGHYIYGTSWTPEIIEKLSEKIELKKFKHSAFCGQLDLLKEFFKYNNVEGEIFKRRFVEVCDKVNDPVTKFLGQIENADFNDIEELAQMAYDYHLEEFQGKGSQNRAGVAASIEYAIATNSLYVWRVDGLITSIVQVINEDDDYAMIGSLYTKNELRGKGYAYFLLHSLSDGLLKNDYVKCGLISDADNPITKKIFSRIGYKPIYNWGLIRKEE